MNKKKIRTILCVLLAAAGLTAVGALAAGGAGSQSDPLVTLSYLTETFTGQIMDKVDDAIARRNAQLLQELPPVAVYEPTYVERPPEVDTGGEVDIQEFDGTWVVDAPWLQRLIANVNFGDYESRNWFDQKLRQSGLFDKLEEMGIKDGDIVSLYDLEFEYQR